MYILANQSARGAIGAVNRDATTHTDIDHLAKPDATTHTLTLTTTLTPNLTLAQNLTLTPNLTLTLSLTLNQIDFADKVFIVKTLFLWALLVKVNRTHPRMILLEICSIRHLLFKEVELKLFSNKN